MLCACKPYARVWKLCYNTVQDLLLKAILASVGTRPVNCIVSGCKSQL